MQGISYLFWQKQFYVYDLKLQINVCFGSTVNLEQIRKMM